MWIVDDIEADFGANLSGLLNLQFTSLYSAYALLIKTNKEKEVNSFRVKDSCFGNSIRLNRAASQSYWVLRPSVKEEFSKIDLDFISKYNLKYRSRFYF